MTQRLWHHSELPDGKPSAAAARLGCRCPECGAALSAYIHEYRTKQQLMRENSDGTTFYHNHKGQPSAKTARHYACIHPRCLYLAGLYLDPDDGSVRQVGTGYPDPDFGAPAA